MQSVHSAHHANVFRTVCDLGHSTRLFTKLETAESGIHFKYNRIEYYGKMKIMLQDELHPSFVLILQLD